RPPSRPTLFPYTTLFRSLLINREVERLFGYPRGELLGQPIELLVPARLRGEHPGLRSDFFARPQARAMGVGRDLYGVRKDGTEIDRKSTRLNSSHVAISY